MTRSLRNRQRKKGKRMERRGMEGGGRGPSFARKGGERGVPRCQLLLFFSHRGGVTAYFLYWIDLE